jgi:hypothetical protein
MPWSKRLATLALATAIGAAGVVAPAGAASKSHHWSTKKCTAYVKKWDKAHKHATKAQINKADKVLKSHACTARVK